MMEDIFKIYNSICILYKDKDILLEKLYSFFTDIPAINDSKDDLLYKKLKGEPLIIYQLIGVIHQKKKEGEKIVNTDKRKHFGIYYTDYSIAKLIAKESLSLSEPKEILDYKFFEPCAGNGIFIVAYLDEALERLGKHNVGTIQKLINQIYFSDIDGEAIDILIKILPLYIRAKYGVSIKISVENFYKGDILFKEEVGEISKVNPKDIFGVQSGFDVVLTNPPYKLLKANGNKYKNKFNENKHALDIRKVIDFIGKNKIYKFNQGTLNYYKIFLEEILENYTHNLSKVGAIIPITLLNDKQSELLRKRIINKYRLFKIYIIPEKNEFFPDISQAFCFFALDKTAPGEVIKINPQVINSQNFNNKGIEVKINHIERVSKSSPIIVENEIGWKILEKLNILPKLGSLNSLLNARGELDLTLYKDFITSEKTSLPLLRGNNIGEFSYSKSNFYTTEKFLSKISEKQKYITKERIVCQQISNIHLEKRLKFTKIPGNIILGNSCNFLTFEDSLFHKNEISLDYLLGVLNSLLLNWRFKITNSNNHISNYELAELPIVIPTQKNREKIEGIVDLIKRGNRNGIYDLNMSVFSLYGLNKIEIDYILGKHEKIAGFFLNYYKNKELSYGI